jgi:hypothetical protein
MSFPSLQLRQPNLDLRIVLPSGTRHGHVDATVEVLDYTVQILQALTLQLKTQWWTRPPTSQSKCINR